MACPTLKPTPEPQKLGSTSVCITGVGTALPKHRWTQQETYQLLARHFPYYRSSRVERMFLQSEIETRHFARPPETYDVAATAGQLHELFLAEAPRLAVRAAELALERGGLASNDITCLVVATCTGYLCPGLTAHVIKELGLRSDIQRADIVGMGCAGAMPALQRGYDHVRSQAGGKALVVAVEVCSACFYADDSLETVVGNIICGDGAAAVVLEGAATQATAPEILGSHSVVDTRWMNAVGLQNLEGKQRIILSKELRKAAGPAVVAVVDGLLAKYALKRSDIAHWVFHAGGAAVLSNIEACLEFGNGELAASREVFRRHGNMSSPTTLFVLDEIQRTARPQPGDLGVALALGPGLATEGALLKW